MYRDPGGFYVYLVAVRLTVASLPYLPAGVSSSPGLAKLGSLRGCNPWPGRSVLRSTLGGATSLEGINLHQLSEPTDYAAGGLYYWRLRATASQPSLRASRMPPEESDSLTAGSSSRLFQTRGLR